MVSFLGCALKNNDGYCIFNQIANNWNIKYSMWCKQRIEIVKLKGVGFECLLCFYIVVNAQDLLNRHKNVPLQDKHYWIYFHALKNCTKSIAITLKCPECVIRVKYGAWRLEKISSIISMGSANIFCWHLGQHDSTHWNHKNTIPPYFWLTLNEMPCVGVMKNPFMFFINPKCLASLQHCD